MRRQFIGFLCAILIILLIPAAVWADGKIIEDYSEDQYGIYYVKNISDVVIDVSTQVGSVMAPFTEWLGSIPQPDYQMRTMILIDNSLSIQTGGRDAKIRELLTQIINGHADGELFAISTFSKTITPLTEFTTDYAALLNVVNTISYADQYAYLVNSIYETVTALANDGTHDYKRVIVISDGVDDNKNDYNTYTSSELIDLLKESSCPVYTIGCKWDKNDSGLNDLFSYARQSGGESFELDSISDLNQIIAVMQEDYGTQLFRVQLPASVLNSGTKTVRIIANTSNGEEISEKTLKMPVLSKQRIDEIAAAEEAATAQSTTESTTETTTTVITTETATETTKAPFDIQDFAFTHWYLFGGVAAALVLIIFAAVRSSAKKKKDDDAFFNESNSEPVSPKGDPSSMRQNESLDYYEKTVKMSDQQNDDDYSTVSLWSASDGIQIHLCDQISGKEYRGFLRDSLTIGKQESTCGIVIPGDNTVSRKHCKVSVRSGRIIIEDLNSSNGTFVNGQQINEPLVLQPGDVLNLGNTVLKVVF